MSRQGIDFIGLINDTAVTLPPVGTGYTAAIAMALGLGVILLLCGFSFLKRKGADDRDFSQLWAGIAALFPVWLGTASFVEYGNLGRDWLHAAYGLGLGLVLIAGAEWLHRQNNEAYRKPLNILRARLVCRLRTLPAHADGGARHNRAALRHRLRLCAGDPPSQLGYSALGDGGGKCCRSWPHRLGTHHRRAAKSWAHAGLQRAAAGLWHSGPARHRLGLDAARLAELPGKELLQAIASVMGLLAVAILIRHAMNGGTLNDSVPTLGEQSIYTLLTIGFSGVLMTLDLKSPSPVFRYGSMIAGVIAVINVLTMHFFTLNPYFTGENTGRIPFLNLLLIGYLLPAFAYGGLAWYARGKRPRPMSACWRWRVRHSVLPGPHFRSGASGRAKTLPTGRASCRVKPTAIRWSGC